MASSPQGSLLDIPSPFQGSLTATDSSGPTLAHGQRVPAAPASIGSGTPSTADVQSDAGEVTYRIELHETAVRDTAAEGGEHPPRERESSRSPVHRLGRGRSSSVGHRGHAHLGPRAQTPEGASSLRAAEGQTPGAMSWVNVGTPAAVGHSSLTSTPAHGGPQGARQSYDDAVDAIPGQTRPRMRSWTS